jgi:uncharacterized protein (TIGR02594 family)
MEKGLFLFIGFVLSFGTLQAKSASWKINKAKIKYVFVPSKSPEGSELIRLYQDKTFEHVVYVPVRKFNKGKENLADVHESTVQRNSGTYSIASGKIRFNLVVKEFSSELYQKPFAFIDNKIYASRFQSIFNQKNFLFKTVNKTKYASPFYLDPLSQRIVRNDDAASKIDLSELAKWLTKGAYSQWTKYQTLVAFVQKQIQINQTAEIDLKIDSSNDLVEKIAGENRSVNRFELADLITEMGEKAGLSVRSIRGYKKQVDGKINQRIPHAWNQVNLGSQVVLSDVSMNKNWLKVDPAVMIHSHFPLNTEDQLLEKPISEKEFDQLAYVEQTKEVPAYISFLPSKQVLVAKGKVSILFDNQVTGIKASFSVFNQQLNTFENPVNVSGINSQIIGTKTLVTVPINSDQGQLTLKLPNGMVVNYFIENNGSEEIEVASYLKGLATQKRVLPIIKTANTTNTSVASNSRLSIIEQWAQSSDSFLNELAALEFSDASVLQNPIIKEARKYFGIEEIEGNKHNKAILNFFKETGNGAIKTDEDAWCSVFVSYCAKEAGLNYSKKANAKSWLQQGTATTNPKPGDIVVFWREDPDSWEGHVAIYLGRDESTNEIICLGGNQDDQVCIRNYYTNRVIGYRTLTKK